MIIKRPICGALLTALLVVAASASAQTATPRLKTLYSFTGGSDGGDPRAGVVIGKGGVLYGTAETGGVGGGTVFQLTPPASPGGAWTETVLYDFSPPGSDGGYPWATVTVGSGGVLYGTTFGGGTGPACSGGCGTVFSLTPPASPGGAWTETVLHSFTGGSDGERPTAGVVIGSGSVLYGTTSSGGTSGYGTVFALKP